MANGIIVRLTHLQKALPTPPFPAGTTVDESILISDLTQDRVGGIESPVYVTVGTPVDMVYTDKVARSFENGAIRQFITSGDISAEFLLGDASLTSGGGIKLEDGVALTMGSDDDVQTFYNAAGDSTGFIAAADTTLFFLGMRQQIGRVTGDPIALRQTTYRNALQTEVEMDTGGAAEDTEAIDAFVDNSGGEPLTTGEMAAFQARLEGNATDAATSGYVGFKADDATDSGGAGVFTGLKVGASYDVGVDVQSGESRFEGHVRLGTVTAPTNVATKGFLYVKDVGAGVTELFYMDHAGNEVQLTNAGAPA